LINVLDWISESFRKVSSKRQVFIFILLFLVVGGLMESKLIGSARLKEISGGTGMIDMQFYYSPDTAYGMLNSMGMYGRSFYSKLLGLDIIFSLAFMFAGSSLITFLLENLKINHLWFKLNTLPLFRSLFDVLENCFLWILILNYPQKNRVVATIAAVMTTTKWLVYTVLLMTLLMLVILSVYRKLKPRILRR